MYSADKICALAKTAHIALTATEVERMQCELDKMYSSVVVLDRMSEETELDEPFVRAIGLSSLREDGVQTDASFEALSTSPHARDGFFVVPRAVEE